MAKRLFVPHPHCTVTSGACFAVGKCMSGECTRSVDDALVMRLWRKAGLPETFLGNGGTNRKLVRFARLVRAAYGVKGPDHG